MVWPPTTHQDVQDAVTALRTTGTVHSQVAANGTDQAVVLQAEIDSLSAAGGGVLVLPAGTIMVSSVVMKHLVTLQGRGKQVTVLKATAGSVAKGLVSFAAGPVFAWLRELEVRGNGNTGQIGIYAQALGAGANNNGGWWFSGLSQVIVRQFDGDQIWLRGGGSDFLKPHQFLSFTDVEAYTTNAKCALRMTGQVGQIQLINCQFDGPGQANAGVNVYLGRSVDDTMTVNDSTSPYFIKAFQVTTQSNKRAVTLDYCSSITWSGYFEAVSEGLSAESSSSGIIVEGCIMGNVGANAGNGFCVQSGSGTQMVVRGNRLGNTADVHLKNTFGSMWAANNYVVGDGNLLTSGLTAQLSVAAGGSLSLVNTRTALVNTSATAITTISSTAGPGETVSIKAWGGTIVLGSGGNINASGRTFPLTVPNNALVTLVKFDLGATWNIQSISA